MSEYTVKLKGTLTIELDAETEEQAVREANRIFDKKLSLDCLYGVKVVSDIKCVKMPVRVLGFSCEAPNRTVAKP